MLLLFERVCVKEQCGNLQVFERVGVRQHGDSVIVLQVFERVGVTQLCPLGVSWQEVPVDSGEEIVALSAGQRTLLWAITWNGAVLARQGISWQHTKGTCTFGRYSTKIILEANSNQLRCVSISVALLWISEVYWNVQDHRGYRCQCRSI